MLQDGGFGDGGMDALADDARLDAPRADAPIEGDAGPAEPLSCPVAVVGGSASGVSAAYAAASLGVRTCLFEASERLGGQLLTVPELDEFPPPGVPADRPYPPSYRGLRDALEAHYRTVGIRDEAACPEGPTFNPGRCSCCRTCYEPAPMEDAIEALLAPLEASGMLSIHRGARLDSVTRRGDAVIGLTVSSAALGDARAVDADVVIDATELGDVLPLAGAAYRTGAESVADTGETHALATANPDMVQPMTFPIFVEIRPEDEDHSIPMPPGYDPEDFRLRFWTPGGWIGPDRPVTSVDDMCGTPPAVAELSWRRMRSRSYLNVATDIAQINTTNDFNHACVGDVPAGCNVIDRDAATREAVFRRGREFSAGFLYYLQHDAPRDDGRGTGYPNLRPAMEITGTPDGVSRDPYVRESRRIRALVTIREDDVAQEIVRATRPGAPRANLFADSVGVGQYALDLHMPATGDPFSLAWHEEHYRGEFATSRERTLPFQIPLGALVPERVDGLVAASKNIGTTHLTNGAYRLHPVEWNIGLAAGVLSAEAVRSGRRPRDIYSDIGGLRGVQNTLVTRFGGPIFWYSDVFDDAPGLFAATQLVAVEGVMQGTGGLAFEPTREAERWVVAIVLTRLGGREPIATACPPQRFPDVACGAAYRGFVEALAELGGTDDGAAFRPEALATRAETAEMFVRVLALPLASRGTPTFSDVPSTDSRYRYIEAAAAAGLFRTEAPGGTFRPGATVTRGAIAQWAYDALRSRYDL